MKDKEIIKASLLKVKDIDVKKIKAIYPHIKVSVVDDKPYYCICWYDIENKEMNIGYGSFNLEFVCEWLNEYFEVVESDFADLITRQQAIVEKSEKVEYFADKTIATLQAENERLEVENQSLRGAANSLKMHYEEAQSEIERLKEQIVEVSKTIKSEAVKEFAEKLKHSFFDNGYESPDVDFDYFVDNLVKEMVGENNG